VVGGREPTIPALAIRHDVGLEDLRLQALRESDGSRHISERSDVFRHQKLLATQKCRQCSFDTENQQGTQESTSPKADPSSISPQPGEPHRLPLPIPTPNPELAAPPVRYAHS
jgi:hypothetical protein